MVGARFGRFWVTRGFLRVCLRCVLMVLEVRRNAIGDGGRARRDPGPPDGCTAEHADLGDS